jgi:hypothetical protein
MLQSELYVYVSGRRELWSVCKFCPVPCTIPSILRPGQPQTAQANHQVSWFHCKLPLRLNGHLLFVRLTVDDYLKGSDKSQPSLFAAWGIPLRKTLQVAFVNFIIEYWQHCHINIRNDAWLFHFILSELHVCFYLFWWSYSSLITNSHLIVI